jgi:transposase-like protein/5-methylcytosine-specific restriction endonuclease McrA
VQFVAKLRWPNGPVCPACGGTEHSYLTTRRVWKCKNRECRKQFSVKVGSIFEDSPIPLDKWLCSIWLVANSKNGISSHELGRSVGLTQKSAWFVLHRIRLAMKTRTFDKFTGEIEADETFAGGRAKNMHARVRREKITAKGGIDKTMVAGTLQRTRDDQPSQVRAAVLPQHNNQAIRNHVLADAEPGHYLYTDGHTAYADLAREYDHATIDHITEYVRGRVHSNGIENFWALLKRGLKGTYVYADPKHLQRYVDERVFTFNERKRSDLWRFMGVLATIAGRRLTYADLTA